MAANAKITDIRVALSLPTNRKIKALRRALGPGACWALIELWIYCAGNEPDGALIGWTAEDVEAVVNWDGVRGEFVTNTVRIGLLDELAGGGFEVHDWEENQPWVASAGTRSAAARRAVEARWARSKAETDTGRIRSEYAANTGGIPPSLPSHLPSITSPPKRASKPALSPSFAAFWQAYPSKTGKGAAERAWARVSPDAQLLDVILQAVAAQKAWRQWVEGFIPNPATWINQRRWEDERPVERVQGAASHIQDVPAERRPAAYKPFELPPEPQDEAPVLSLRDVSETARRRLGGGA